MIKLCKIITKENHVHVHLAQLLSSIMFYMN